MEKFPLFVRNKNPSARCLHMLGPKYVVCKQDVHLSTDLVDVG